jgi:hypothetical protein
MATLTTGEPSLGADGEEESRSSIAMAKTWRVTLGHLRDRLLGHGTGRGRRVVAFALAGAKRGVLATASRLAPSFGLNGYPHSRCGCLVAEFHGSARPMAGRPGGGSLPMRGGGSSMFGIRARTGANGSTVVDELALRPGFHPKPECHRRRVPRHEARGLGY